MFRIIETGNCFAVYTSTGVLVGKCGDRVQALRLMFAIANVTTFHATQAKLESMLCKR